MKLQNWFARYVTECDRLINHWLRDAFLDVERVIDAIAGVSESGGQIFVVGNGGSAAMANHFAIDMNKCANDGTPDLGIRCHSLAANPSELLAWSNDCSFDSVFCNQLSRVARPGDMLFAVSASGLSKNIVAACEWARYNQMFVVALTSEKVDYSLEKAVDDFCEVLFKVPSRHYGRIEDMHSTILHIIAYAYAEGVALECPSSITEAIEKSLKERRK
jgi:phosphoheptose isomerase